MSLQQMLSAYILTGSFMSDLSPVLTEETFRRICTKFAVSLHTLGFGTRAVRIGYLATTNEWRICIISSGWVKY
ncbi:hypothetical protein BDV09DRAFT_45008 [Aspergillus tetrazonus]